MNKFKIALLQMAPLKSIEGNLEKGIIFCRKAKSMGADLALFPEAWSVGYEAEKVNANYAINNENIFIKKHLELAKKITACHSSHLY